MPDFSDAPRHDPDAGARSPDGFEAVALSQSLGLPTPDKDQRGWCTPIGWNECMREYNKRAEIGDHQQALGFALGLVQIAEAISPQDYHCVISYQKLAGAYWQVKKYALAEAWLRRALERHTAMLPGENPARANLWEQLGEANCKLEDYPAALDAFHHALSIMTADLNCPPAPRLGLRLRIAQTHRAAGQAAEADRQLVAIFSELRDLRPSEYSEAAAVLNQAGSDAMTDKRFDDADLLFQEALRLLPEGREEQPRGHAWLLGNQAEPAFAKGEYQQALERFETAVKAAESCHQPWESELIAMRTRLAELLQEMGDPSRGERILRENVETLKAAAERGEAEPVQLWLARRHLLGACLASYKIVDAEAVLDEMLESIAAGDKSALTALIEAGAEDLNPGDFAARALELTGPENAAALFGYLVDRASTMMARHAEETKTMILRAQALAELLPISARDDAVEGFIRMRLAQCCFSGDENAAAAEELAESEAALGRCAPGERDEKLPALLDLKFDLARAEGRLDDACEYLTEAEALYRRSHFKRETLMLAGLLKDWGEYCMDLDDAERAESYLAQAHEMLERRGRGSHPLNITVLHHLSEILGAQGRTEEAEALSLKAKAAMNELELLNDRNFMDGLLGL